MSALNNQNFLLHQLFEDVVPAFEDIKAVSFRAFHLTYKELNSEADKLAQTILLKAPNQEIIGLSTTRSLEMIIALLAILKSGKAYLPLDPNFPISRLEQIVSGSGISVCIAQSAEFSFFTELKLDVIAADSAHLEGGQAVVHQNSNACVLYTSGSTGKPKGVCVPHQGLVNFILWQKENSRAAPGLNTSQFCHLGFDVSIEEIFVPLTTGGTLYLMDDTIRLDSGNLLRFIRDNEIHRMYLPYVELQYFAEEALKEEFYPESLIEVITGGEALKITPQISALFNSLKGCPLINKYGPTEACIWVTELELNGDTNRWPEVPTIGKPIGGVTVYILNDNLELMPNGEEGEICIHGKCVANGYLNEPALTAKSFIDWTDPRGNQLRLYKTGDLGLVLPDGNIAFHGRRDGQVKIRGNRVELADIEVALSQQPGVQQAVVTAREDIPGKKYLVAYLVSNSGGMDISQIRNQLNGALPDYMIPSFFVPLDELPKTSSGKVDRKALPKPEAKRPEIGTLYKSPTSTIEKNIADVLIGIFQYDRIGVDDNFFELGGNSLLAQKAISELKHQFEYILPITKLYHYPTVAGMAAYVDQAHTTSVKSSVKMDRMGNRHTRNGGDIAVISMAGRFPGANNIEELWEILAGGKETITFFANEDLDPLLDPSLTNDPFYVAARGIVKDVDQFDPEFFGINPKLAQLMDPQQRIFMEICWEALETTGYVPQKGHQNIGVFAGSYNNTYFLNNVQHHKELVDQVGEFQVMSANEKDYIASRVAYHLNLKGPAVSVYSACSTSLLAIAQAVESLRKGQCSLALAGGASIHSPVNSGHLYQEGAMLSANGHCCPFDANSTGTMFSDGAGVVLLKPLEIAEKDGDTIYAVIKGVGINNDGGDKGSFTAPSASGQAGAILMALEDAQVDPSTLTYVEAHGTGTPLGDPIEMEGLNLAFGAQQQAQYCAIGSIKSNIGHLTAAAGVAGFIKTVLAMRHRQIPPSLGFKIPNPHIDFANSPFYVNQKLSPWTAAKRLAGVSSFGVGGTNVHVILEAYEEQPVTVDDPEKTELIIWSAKSLTSRDAYRKELLKWTHANPSIPLQQIAASLQQLRASFNHRSFAIATATNLPEQLEGEASIYSNSLSEVPGEIVFCFPGQGAQYLQMGRELYEKEAVYKKAVDACAEILLNYLHEDIREILFPASTNKDAEEILTQTQYTQPALFATEYALAKLWMSLGIQPTVVCGHSLGEYVAAHLAGIFSLEDALKVVAARGALIGQLPKGNMLSVRSSIKEIENILPEELSVAAINSRQHCVVSGKDEHIHNFAQYLDLLETPHQILHTSHAFHSRMMEPAVSKFKEILASIQLNNPTRPIISTVSGTWLKDEQATDVSYWTEHIMHTVRFADALQTVNALGKSVFIEVGPGRATSTLAKMELDKEKQTILTSLELGPSHSEHEAFLTALGKAWLHGLEPDWKALHGGRKAKFNQLPNYVFDRHRCWVSASRQNTEPAAASTSAVSSAAPNSSHPQIPDFQLKSVVDRVLEMAGVDHYDPTKTFLEIGLDSLILTQVALNLRKEFDLPITFRKLNEEFNTPLLLSRYLAENHQPSNTNASKIDTTAPQTSKGWPEGDLMKAVASISDQMQQLHLQLSQLKELMGKKVENRQHEPVWDEDLSASSTKDAHRKPVTKMERSLFDAVAEQGYNNANLNPDSLSKELEFYLYPPVADAKLGKDPNGNPGWFIKDPEDEHSYLQVIPPL